MAIKSAAVPHYSKSNNKVVYAVRVCPVSPAQEPYTVYRRWDEFLDFSAKLASIFPTSNADDPDPSLYRRIRLSRKVTLFVTTATHTSRRDELDLFVRHLFSLPSAITSFPLVQDFFAIKNNCLDGLSPPSPTPNTGMHAFDGPMPTFLQHSSHAISNNNNNGKKIHKAKSNDNLLYPTVKERSPSDGGEATLPSSPFRPTLTAKRSTPDLRRFVSSQPPEFLSGRNALAGGKAAPPPPLPIRQTQDDFPTTSLTSSPATSPYPAQLNFRFPRPAPRPPTEIAAPVPAAVVAAENDDVASTRTASTIKPSRSGSTSRISSPLSFMSDATEENYSSSSTSTITPGNYSMKSAATRPGALKHFRSLQDIRAVVTPRPQLPASAQPSPVREPSYAPAPAPPMARTRSESKILMKPLPQVVEDETSIVPPYSAPLSRNDTTSSSRRRPSVQTSVQPVPAHQHPSLGSPISPASETRFHRPSISSLRKLQMTSFSSQHQMHNQQQQPSATSPRSRSNHAQSSSISSLSSTDSASSFSLSRSTSSGGLGLDFCSSSRESLELSSEHSSSSFIASPDLSAIAHSPSSASSWQYQGNNDYNSRNNNHLPPLPFFPFPATYEAPKLSRKPSRTRSRASSLHTPVLETILASPVLGGPEPAEPEAHSITLKIMTSGFNNNFLMKVSRTSSLKQVREKVVSKCQTSHIEIDEKQFELVINPGSNKGAGATAGSTTAGKTSKMFDEATLGSIANLSGIELDQAGIVKLEDEEDWQLAVSLTKAKITLRIL